jgi:hypothetical protein
MKAKAQFVALWAAVAAIAAMAVAAPARGETTSVLLEEGIFKEETAGDLDGAIRVYQRIVDDAQANRKFIAQALYRLGSCLLKKGQDEAAAAALRRLIAQYPEQKALVDLARRKVPATPFPEVVGCRIRKRLALEVRPPSAKSPYRPRWTLAEYSRVEITWRVDPRLAERAKAFAVTVRPNLLERLRPSATWQVLNLPAKARHIVYGEAAGGGKPGPELRAGEHHVTVHAFDAAQKGFDPQEAIGLAAGVLVVRPLVDTQIVLNDVQPSGAIRFRTVMQQLNRSSKPLEELRFINSDSVEVKRMEDDAGRPLKFTVDHRERTYHYRVHLNEPVAPGGAVLHASEGSQVGKIRQAEDTYRYRMQHWPGGGQTRRIEIHRLPKGAELLATAPKDLPRRTRSGRIELLVDEVIPPGGSLTTAYTYRLPMGAPGGKPLELSHDDGTAEGKLSIAGSGHAVAFECPGKAGKVVGVRIFASRYGYPQAPDEDFHVYLLDGDRKVLADHRFAYGLIARGPAKWYALRTPPTAVPKRFHVALAFNPHRTKGIYLSYDKGVEESHSFTGLPSRGFRPVAERYDWMVRVQLAREGGAPVPAGGLKVGPAPWPDGERMRLALRTKTRLNIGTITYTAQRRKGEGGAGGPCWRIESYMVVPDVKHRQFTRVDADLGTFAPRTGWTRSPWGDFRAVYRAGKVRLAVEREGKKTTRDVPLTGPIYDNEQVLHLIRRLPLKEDYAASLPIFPVQGGVVMEARIRVAGTEKVTWAGGEMDCHRVVLELHTGGVRVLRNELWVSTGPKRMLVRYDAGTAVMGLLEYGRVDEKARKWPVNKEWALTKPPEWHFHLDSSQKTYKLLVHLLAPELAGWGMFAADGRPDGVASARQFAESRLARLQGYLDDYKVRPESWSELKVGKLPGIRYVADYKDKGRSLVEYRTYLLDESMVYWFIFRTDRAGLDAWRKSFDGIVSGLQGR